MRQPSPSRVAVVVRLLRLGAVLDERGGEQHVAGDDLRRASPAARRCRSARSAAPRATSVGITGSGATLRPTSRSTMHRSRKPKPRPPADSGQRDAEQVRLGELAPRVEVVPVVGAVALLQVLQRPCGPRGSAPRGPRSSCCSSVSAKSMRRLLRSSARAAGHVEPEDRDQVALHLVGAAAEREDVHAAQHALDAAAQHRAGRVALRSAPGRA